MPSVKVFAMTFDFLNEERTFSEGDIISGEVTLNLEKDNKVESLFVKATGDANVRWSEKRGDKTHTYSDHRRYFKVKEFLIPENNKDTMIPKGVNVYKFALKIPSGSLPSSFKGLHGKIVYKLEAKLSRSWKMDRQVVNELNFASRAACMSNLGHLMTRSVGSTDKAMTFSKGQVHMDAVLEKLIYAPGETVAVVVKVNNSSSKSMTPKLKLIHKIVYSAHASTKYEEHTICKLVGDVIETTTEQTVNFALKLPTDLTPAIQNCDIISVQYQLKVYLDISFSFDPEVTFLLVIAPVGFTSGRPEQYPPVAFGRPFVPPSASTVPGFGYPEQPPVYPPFALMPSVQPAAAAVHNPMPPRVSPYGSPFSSSSSSPVHHPPPTGPFPPPPPAPVFNPTPPPPAFNPTPPAPVFYPTPPAPAFNPTPSAPPLFGQSSTAPTFNLPSAPMMNTDFLSQQDEEPPSYLSMFPPSTPYKKETPD